MIHRFATCFAGSALFALSAAVAQGYQPAQPTEAAFLAQVKLLDGKHDVATRRKALAWIGGNTRAKAAAVAVPALERCTRLEPDKEIRQRAVSILSQIAKSLDRPCPRAVIVALVDREDFVRWEAAVWAHIFKSYAPGCVKVLLRGVDSDMADVRSTCLLVLARAAGKDKRALAAFERAKRDKVFDVRHSAYWAAFRAVDRLDEFLPYVIRLGEDPGAVLTPAPEGSELRKQERMQRNMFLIGLGISILEWSETRVDEFAAALMKRLADQSALVRRGAANLIARSLVKFDLSAKTNRFSPLDIYQSDANKEVFKQIVPPTLPDVKFMTPSAVPLPAATKKKARPEKSKVALRLEQLNVEQALRQLRDRDPDQSARGAARRALERLASFNRSKP